MYLEQVGGQPGRVVKVFSKSPSALTTELHADAAESFRRRACAGRPHARRFHRPGCGDKSEGRPRYNARRLSPLFPLNR